MSINNKNPIYLKLGDRIVFLIGCPISTYCSLILILGYFTIKNLRKRPGGLILGMSISDIILSIHWFILGIDPTLADSKIYCIINAVISTLAGINTLLYNISLYLYLINELRNVLKQSKISQKVLHIFNIIISIIIVFAFLATGKLGRNLFGTCSIAYVEKSSIIGYLAILIFAAYLFFGIYTYIYIKRNAPKCSLASKNRAMILSHYLNYVIASGIIWGILAISYLIIFAIELSDSELQSIIIIGNVAKLCSPLVMTIIRYSLPNIRNDMQKLIFFWRQYDKKDQCMINNTDENEITLRNTLRLQLAFTFLAGILIANNDQRRRHSSFNLKQSNKMTKSDSLKLLKEEGLMEFNNENKYKYNSIYVIKEDILAKDKEYFDKFLKSKGLSIIEGTCKVYAPQIFRDFLNDETDVDLKESFDFEVNYESIKEAMNEKTSTQKGKKKQGDGGKSGEFFLFSKDKKLILKTIPENEKSKLLSCLPNYQQHLINNPNSFLVRILGLYSFLSFDSDETYNLIVMRNINGYPSKYVERTYDMKGSKFDRKVIKTMEDETPEMLKRVLKDSDFYYLEGKINICKNDSVLIVNQLVKDVDFLRRCGFIDYSFIIFKINKAKFAEDKLKYLQDSVGLINQSIKEFKKDSVFELFLAKSKNIKSYESINPSEKGIFYHLGIIDFLQAWNFSKKLERLLKRLSRANFHLDTSSQDPETYAQRFKNELIYKIFPDTLSTFETDS